MSTPERLYRYVIYEENMDGKPRFVAMVADKLIAAKICEMLNGSSSESYMFIFEREWIRVTDGD